MSVGVKIKMLRLIIIASEIITIAILAWVIFSVRSCGREKKDNNIISVCSIENEVLELPCPQGETGRILQVCKSGRYETTFKDCKASACSGVTFNQTIKPIIDANCVSCHSGFNEYATAKAKIDAFINRVNLDPTDPARMPKAPNEPLKDDVKAKFKEWKDGGLLEACEGDQVNNNPHIYLDYIEEAIDQDLAKLSSAQQSDSRYLIIAHKSNEGGNPDQLRQFKNGINKAINSLSTLRNLHLSEPIDQYQVVYRFSLRGVGLKAADWKLVEDREPINLESNTNRGRLLKQLTRTRKPWLHIDSFTFTANDTVTYYELLKLPKTVQELFQDIGLDFNGDIDDFEALFLGFTNSPISLNKNRLVGRWQTDDLSAWISFDTALNQGGNSNLFSFPLLKSVDRNRNFQFLASEMIYSLPNQLHAYYLFNNVGARQNAAPQDIVQDNVVPQGLSREIIVGRSCFRCHSAGYIPAKDEIKQHVLSNPTEFLIRDIERVEALHRPPEDDFKADNAAYAEALSKIGILANEADPINVTSDNLRRNMNAKAVSSLLLLTEEEFLEGLERSAEARAQVGALLAGGAVTFETLVKALPIIIRDLNLGEEPIIP